jgi:hypothetical protein
VLRAQLRYRYLICVEGNDVATGKRCQEVPCHMTPKQTHGVNLRLCWIGLMGVLSSHNRFEVDDGEQ